MLQACLISNYDTSVVPVIAIFKTDETQCTTILRMLIMKEKTKEEGGEDNMQFKKSNS